MPEPQAPTRNAFQRDRDRIVHSTAFRRLVYKTQVFLNHEGDLFRTRLTHSLEVAQLGRSVARSLGLHEDLVEAIALAHDLGHTPFGHAGQDALAACMADWGGFEHNLQSLRVVDALEERYASFDGLNLCFETREGILKHCTTAQARLIEAREPGGVALRFLKHTSPSLEAQLANLADAIAYNAHDIDDGVRSGLLQVAQLLEVPLFARHQAQALREHPRLTQAPRRLLYETIRRMLSQQVYDVIATTAEAAQAAGVSSLAEVRAAAPLVRFSQTLHQQSKAMQAFLFQHLYRHPQVAQTTANARRVVQELFAIYLQRPAELPQQHGQRHTRAADPAARARVVSDYIAGMTDRFAAREHQRLTGLNLLGG